VSRKHRGLPINGWLIIDKPVGLSSAAVVGRVRRLTEAAKAGHGGTLDPLASGVLPVALGEATKTVSYVMDGAKTYRWRIAWGEARSTDDAEGDVVATSPRRPTAAEIERVLPAFIGNIMQTPPVYSALKVGGHRAYELARAEQPVTLAARPVRIDRLVLDAADGDGARFTVECGKGTYIRALARDLARALGTVGYVLSLRRIKCGPFCEKEAISLDKLEDFRHSAASANLLLPVVTALDDIPALALTEDEARRLQSGQSVPITEPAARSPHPSISAGTTVRAMAEGRLVALARIDDGQIRPLRVLNL
jgi:tRNA pseudouridine55 synthase